MFMPNRGSGMCNILQIKHFQCEFNHFKFPPVWNMNLTINVLCAALLSRLIMTQLCQRHRKLHTACSISLPYNVARAQKCHSGSFMGLENEICKDNFALSTYVVTKLSPYQPDNYKVFPICSLIDSRRALPWEHMFKWIDEKLKLLIFRSEREITNCLI